MFKSILKNFYKLLPFTLLILCSCNSTQRNGIAKESCESAPIRMAVILPLSSVNADAAADAVSGVKLAQEKINSTGKNLELIILDSSNPDFACIETINNLKSKGVKIFNIGFSNLVASRYEALKKIDGVFYNFLCEYPPAVVGMNNATRIFLNSAQEGDILSKLVDRSDGRVKHIIAMNVDDFYGRSAGAYLAFNLKLAKTKFYSDVFKQNEGNFDVFAKQIERLSIEHIFYTGYGKELPAFIESLKEQNNCKVMANCGFYQADCKLPQNVSFYRIKTHFQQGKLKNKEHTDFVRDYLAKYTRHPNWISACAYDSIINLYSAALHTKSSPKELANYFKNKKINAAMGVIEFDSSGDTIMQIDAVKE